MKELQDVDEIIVSLMSGPRDGDMLPFETLLDSDRPLQITIGRREGSDVCLSYDSQVSREHAIVIYDGQQLWLEDLNSTNGTYLEDEKITGRMALKPGQLFRIGRTWLRVEPLVPYSPLDDDSLPF